MASGVCGLRARVEGVPLSANNRKRIADFVAPFLGVQTMSCLTPHHRFGSLLQRSCGTHFYLINTLARKTTGILLVWEGSHPNLPTKPCVAIGAAPTWCHYNVYLKPSSLFHWTSVAFVQS